MATFSIRIGVFLASFIVSPFILGTCLAQESDRLTEDEFFLKYAQIYLQLAEANLAFDQARESALKGIVSKARLDERREDVRVAKKMLSVAEQGGRSREFEVFVRLAAAGYRLAYGNWQRAKKVHERAPTKWSDEDVIRTRLRAELALLNFERGKSLIGGDVEQQKAWKINLLFDEVIRLNARLEQLSRLSR